MGICSNCGTPRGKRQHDIHHWRYLKVNKLAHTQELCPKCHKTADKLRRAGKKSF